MRGCSRRRSPSSASRRRGGSGSTKSRSMDDRFGLVARLVELEPQYCDVICRRYQEHTGVMPILERTGEGVTFVSEAK